MKKNKIIPKDYSTLFNLQIFKSLMIRCFGPTAIYKIKSLWVKRTFDEIEFIFKYFDKRGPHSGRTMIDVGAHYGTSLVPFLTENWTVHAFEPDRANRRILNLRYGHWKNILINKAALSKKQSANAAFFTSTESSGVSTLNPFLTSHKNSSFVNVDTLSNYCTQASLEKIDFLKIDTEGNDLAVLQGLDFETLRPEVIMCEFDDQKSRISGYKLVELFTLLEQRGYFLVLSEWHPVARYGGKHRWKALHRSFENVGEGSWGNIIAFREPIGAESFIRWKGDYGLR